MPCDLPARRVWQSEGGNSVLPAAPPAAHGTPPTGGMHAIRHASSIHLPAGQQEVGAAVCGASAGGCGVRAVADVERPRRACQAR